MAKIIVIPGNVMPENMGCLMYPNTIPTHIYEFYSLPEYTPIGIFPVSTLTEKQRASIWDKMGVKSGNVWKDRRK